MIKFDFNEAVAQAKHDYPMETADITFIDATRREAPEQLKAALDAMSPVYRNWVMKSDDDDIQELIIQGIIDDIGPMGLQDPFTNKSILMFNPHVDIPKSVLSHEASKFLVFNHELGHLILKGGCMSEILRDLKDLKLHRESDQPEIAKLINKDEQLRENMADGFGVTRGLAQGWLTVEDVEKIALLRAKDTIELRDGSHLTTLTLDSIVVDAKAANFMRLSPREVKAIASAHAALCTPTSAEAKIVSKLGHVSFKLATAMSRALKDNPADISHAAYIAARVLEAELATDKTLQPPEKRRLEGILAERKMKVPPLGALKKT